MVGMCGPSDAQLITQVGTCRPFSLNSMAMRLLRLGGGHNMVEHMPDARKGLRFSGIILGVTLTAMLGEWQVLLTIELEM